MIFDNVKKNLGFGMMRLPMIDKDLDIEQINKMVDLFMQSGFNYFDTAKEYLSGLSEVAVRECVAKRYPRESFIVADKLTSNYFNSEEDIYKCFDNQLFTCGVEYFDYYLMHAQGMINYDKYKRYHAYEIAKELKKREKLSI